MPRLGFENGQPLVGSCWCHTDGGAIFQVESVSNWGIGVRCIKGSVRHAIGSFYTDPISNWNENCCFTYSSDSTTENLQKLLNTLAHTKWDDWNLDDYHAKSWL